MRLELSPDQDAYRRTVRAFAETHIAPQAAAIDESNEFPRDLVLEAGRHGLLGVVIPTSDGGSGRDYLSYALAIEEISAASASVGAILAVNNSLVAEVVAKFGSDSQRDQWLRALSTGRSVWAFALSEPDAGTDAANQQTVAAEDGDGYRLTGRKVWVANAVSADVVLVFAATTPGVGGRGISAFLVPVDTAGVSRSEASDSLGVRGLGATDLILDEVRLGPDALVGDRGKGFQVAMCGLDGGRVAVGAQALGIGRAANSRLQSRGRQGPAGTVHPRSLDG